jgi:ribonuclease HI
MTGLHSSPLPPPLLCPAEGLAIDHPHTLIILCDGGYRKLAGKPGIATYAWLIRRAGGCEAYRESGVACCVPKGCSLRAEFAAIVAALRWLRRLALPPCTRIEVCTDCQSVVDRLSGQFQGRRWRGIKMLYRTALRDAMWLRAHGHQVVFQKVPRGYVSTPDKLCRKAYESPAARHPKSLTRFVRQEKPSDIPRRNDLYAKLFTKVGRRPDAELRASRTQ